jgi:hypothetical protein
MKVSYEWYNPEPTILRYRYVGEWDWEDVFPVVEAAWKELNQLPHTVYVIHDMTEGSHIPYNTAAQFARLARISHAKVVLAVIVTPNSLVWSLYRIFSNVYFRASQKFVVCGNLEQALLVIQQAQKAS